MVYAGLVGLSLTMIRHRKQLLPGISSLQPGMHWALRVTGWATLLIALDLCIDQHGFGIGLTLWTGLLSAAALLLAMLAVYLPRLALGLTAGVALPLILPPGAAALTHLIPV